MTVLVVRQWSQGPGPEPSEDVRARQVEAMQLECERRQLRPVRLIGARCKLPDDEGPTRLVNRIQCGLAVECVKCEPGEMTQPFADWLASQTPGGRLAYVWGRVSFKEIPEVQESPR